MIDIICAMNMCITNAWFLAVLCGPASTLGFARVHVQVLPLHADLERQREHLHPGRNLLGQVYFYYEPLLCDDWIKLIKAK